MGPFAEDRGAIISAEWLDTLELRHGGNEHDTYVDPQFPGWRIKVTGPSLVLREGRQRIPAFTEREYLESAWLANVVFGDGIEFVGIIPSSLGPRLVIRQPEVEAADPDHPHPDKRKINAWLRAAGFEYDEGAWTREADGVVVSDEHEGNCIATTNGIRPIDLHIRRLKWASGSVIPWEKNAANPDRRAD